MEVVVPQYFFEHKPDDIIGNDHFLCVAYSSMQTTRSILVRNRMHAMIVILSGHKEIYHLNTNTNRKLKEGDIVLLGEGSYLMSEIVADKTQRYEAVLIYFDDLFISRWMEENYIEIDPKGNKSHCVYFQTDDILHALLSHFYLFHHRSLAHKESILNHKTQEIFLYLLSQHRESFLSFLRSNKKLSHASQCMKQLEDRLDTIHNVHDMARLCQMSLYELRRRFREQVGISPKKWLDHIRLEQAKRLLRMSELTITQIAYACGYGSSSWFSARFKQRYQMTPKQYRQDNNLSQNL